MAAAAVARARRRCSARGAPRRGGRRRRARGRTAARRSLAARARLAEGRALAAAGERAAAVEALRDAERELHALRRRCACATRPSASCGASATASCARATATGGGPLTAREREIAELVAAGRTNREVAEQLVAQHRTVEAHLRSIYGKLDVRSRIELAHALRRVTPGDDPEQRRPKA